METSVKKNTWKTKQMGNLNKCNLVCGKFSFIKTFLTSNLKFQPKFWKMFELFNLKCKKLMFLNGFYEKKKN